MFPVYINDLVNVTNRCKYVIDADDTTLLIVGNDIKLLHDELQHDLQRMKQWIAHNKLYQNIKKINLILFKNRSDNSDYPPVTVENEIMKQVQHTKFLRVIANEHLN